MTDTAAAAPEDDRIITHAMLREQDQERIELLESLIKTALARLVLKGDDADDIRAALNGG
jgi:hypothetical protein